MGRDLHDDLPWISDTLPEAVWRRRQESFGERHSAFLSQQVERRAQRVKDPTLDFLFEYYGYPPSRLLTWTPGFGQLLEGPGAREFLRNTRYVECERGVYLSAARLIPRRRALRWIRELLHTTLERPPVFHCFGIHEWALVHGSKLKHPSFDLRVSREEIGARLAGGIRCTHYDAFRFFSPEAKALTELELSAETMLETEQPGCLHTNMDLYRWAQKLAPYVESELLGDTFELACEARRIDSATSPYDLERTGIPPLKVETEAGREVFVAAQRRIWEASVPLRRRLIAAYDRVLPWLQDPEGESH
jgi:hypothetical protein